MKKGTIVRTARDLDMRDTGGPLIPRGTRALVLRTQRGGLVWVDFGGDIGRRRETKQSFEELS